MSLFLSAADLASMQATQLQAMPGTVVIQRYTTTSNGMGGAWETWAAVGTAIGRIYPMMMNRGQESATGGQVISVMKWWGTLPIGTDVNEKDRLSYQGRTWEVIGVNNSEMWKTAVRCELESLNEEDRT